MSLTSIVRRLLNTVGMDVVRLKQHTLPPEASVYDVHVADFVSKYTMTTQDRLWALLNSVDYILKSNLHGDFVECGVWRGGSAMAIAMKLAHAQATDSRIWLYDTFTGMTPPSAYDIEAHSKRTAAAVLAKTRKGDGENVWCIASKADVMANMAKTKFPLDQIIFVEGDIVHTLDEHRPERIALLRLDTDWYESTLKELECLLPRVVSGGVCIIDDYGYWEGARRAVDEYMKQSGMHVLLHKIDATGRIFVKP